MIWPLFIAFGFKYKGLRKHLLGITLIGAAVSALLMGLIYQPDTDPSRVYYGTDTRAFSILFGAGLAFIWPSQKLSANLAKSSQSFLDIMGSLALIMIIIMIWLTNQYDNFIYQGGLVVLSIATVIVIAVIAHPSTLLGRILGVKPLRWIGVRSYGMYLWHTTGYCADELECRVRKRSAFRRSARIHSHCYIGFAVN
ncbi:acyltransferase [Terrilactibacillus sp. S3-3]|nr:acyltransferase [Terrilactibacillus sp. S3-3]